MLGGHLQHFQHNHPKFENTFYEFHTDGTMRIKLREKNWTQEGFEGGILK